MTTTTNSNPNNNNSTTTNSTTTTTSGSSTGNNYQSFLDLMMHESDDHNNSNSNTASATSQAKEAAMRDRDIVALLEAGVDMMKLEELYGVKVVQKAAEAYITRTSMGGEEEQEDHHDRQRSKLATLLFLRAPSSSLQSIMKSDQVIDLVFQALVADPEDPLLMDPLLHTPMHDPVVLSSGVIVDRSTAMDPVTHKLRLQKCPFRRIPLSPQVYEVIPLQEKVRAWEHDRLDRCVSVAQTMMKQQQYERCERVFQIAHGFLQEHTDRHTNSNKHKNKSSSLNTASSGPTTTHYNITNISPQRQDSREILLLAIQLAQLEREVPGVSDNVDRTVQIHQRLISIAQACSTDPADVATLVDACLEDCWKRCHLLLALHNHHDKALAMRQAFAPLIKYTTLCKLNLTEQLQKVCRLDLTLAKHVDDEASIWNCRRGLLQLLSDEKEKAEFCQQEGITGDEDELYIYLPYDYAHWPQDKFLDKALGLVHFGLLNVNNNNPQQKTDTDKIQTQGLPCSVDLNPHPQGDHWIEVAFRPDKIQSPGHLNSIFSQHGPNTGWEIRCAVKPRSTFFATIATEENNGGIHVEAVWTSTSPVRGKALYNELINTQVPIEIGTWYHVFLVYCAATQTLSLYVNGTVERAHKISGDFVPEHRLPVLGQNVHWKERQFHGWVAFASGGYEIPIENSDEAALDKHVQRLAQARLSKLPKQQPIVLRYQGSSGVSSALEDVTLDASGKSIQNDSDSSDDGLEGSSSSHSSSSEEDALRAAEGENTTEETSELEGFTNALRASRRSSAPGEDANDP